MRITHNQIALFSLTIFPIFTLIVRGWTSSFLFFYLLVSVVYLKKNKLLSLSAFREKFYSENPRLLLIVIPFAMPIIGILLTSMGKHIFAWHDLDGPSRYCFATIFLLFLMYRKPDIQKYLILSITLMPVITTVLIRSVHSDGWSLSSRLTVYFIDPITFGSLCLSFGLLSLALACQHLRNNLVFLWCCLSACCGFYLSLASESRTGWLSIPFALFLILVYGFRISFIKTTILILIITPLATLAMYQTSDIVHNKIDHSIQDVRSYQWAGGELNSTSIGDRISFARIGWSLMMQRPLTGWANLDPAPHLENSEFSNFANAATRLGVWGGGFHNEFINNGAKYGIIGFVFTIALLLGPGIFFFQILRTQRNNRFALLGVIFVVAQGISCLSYQVLDFKFTASLYALMIVSLAYLALSELKLNFLNEIIKNPPNSQSNLSSHSS
jgi:O-antigen ligase